MSDRNSSESADKTEQLVGLGDFLKYYQPGSGEKQKEWHERILPGIQDALIANPTELIGSSYTNSELKKDAGIICRLLTAGNWIDVVCTQGVLSFAFGSSPIGFVLSIVTNLLILKIKNDAGVAIVRARSGTFPTRIVGTFTLLGLSALSCSVSGVGTELTLNPSGLADLQAARMIESERVRVAALQPDSKRYDRAQAECDQSKQDLNLLPAKGARHDTAYVRTYGMFKERNREWELEESGIPLCVKADMLNKQLVEQSVNLSQNWQNKMATRSQIGNDLEFLKQEMPGSYKKYFTDNGEFRSGVLAIELASQSFSSKLSKGDFAGLGASLFFSSLSVVTTIAACGAVMAFPFNRDAKLSWDGEIAHKRDRILDREISKKVSADEAAKKVSTDKTAD
jgi:hypothetical protein